MGSEYPRQEDRRHTSGSVRQFPGVTRKSITKKSTSSTSAGVTSRKIPKTALTPISRLKKFQKLRDRNLRKEVLSKNNIRKQLKMLENVEVQPSGTGVVKSPQKLKELIKLENGEKETVKNLKENGENGLNGIEEELEVVEQNGVQENVEVRKSPRRSRTKEQEVMIVKEIDEIVETLSKTDEEDKEDESPGRRSPEAREIEVNVKVIESPASSSRKKSTPRRGSPDITSTLPDKVENTSSPDLNSISENLRISGRRPIRDMSPPRKRKSDEYTDEPFAKRMAFTPSVPSPGWRFLSPFSLFKRTPRTISKRPVDDSLFVNVSTDSEVDIDLDTSIVSDPVPEEIPESSNESMERPSPESPSKSSMSWLCRLM